MFIDPVLETDNTSVGVMLTVEDSDSFTVTANNSPDCYDIADYSFDGAISIDENNGATCEIRVGFKNGISKNISAKVRFIDSDGNLSNVYPFTVINSYYSETTELIITEEETDETESKTTQSQKTTKEKTTKEKTTKEKTTREKTTKEKTTKKKVTTEKEVRTTDYTLKPRTTKAEKKKTEFHIQTSPPYSYVRKTKAPKTTKSLKTTVPKAPKTTKQKPATVYYYEKEIVISHIYVTAEETSLSDVTTSVTSNITATAPTPTNLSETKFIEHNKKTSLSDGTKYKIIIGVLSAISFTVLAFASSKSAMKKSDNNNEPDSQ